jgi:hypothetical protein
MHSRRLHKGKTFQRNSTPNLADHIYNNNNNNHNDDHNNNNHNDHNHNDSNKTITNSSSHHSDVKANRNYNCLNVNNNNNNNNNNFISNYNSYSNARTHLHQDYHPPEVPHHVGPELLHVHLPQQEDGLLQFVLVHLHHKRRSHGAINQPKASFDLMT